jgi:hypothetical protein
MTTRLTRAATRASALAAFALSPIVLANQGCTAPTTESTDTSSAAVSGMHRHGITPKVDESSGLRPETAPAGAHLVYNGGRINSAPKVYVVLWGSGSYESHVTSSGTPSMLSFYEQVLSNGSYTTWLNSEYNTVTNSYNGTKTNQNISAGSAVSVIQITPSSSSATVDDSTIQTELQAQISAGHLPAVSHDSAGNPTTYYAIFFPHGTTITMQGSSSCVAGGFCAYHGTVQTGSTEFYYGVHPDMQSGSGCDTGCGNASTAFGNYTSVASHELTEMTTDAEVGVASNASGPPLAWYDQNNGEIGDICNAQQANYTACDGQTYVLQQEYSNAHSNCINVPSPTSCGTVSNDFGISASSSSISVTAGSSTTDAIDTTIASGSSETVALSASGAPSGMTVSFSPTSVASGANSTMTVSTTSSVAAGTYSITVTGTASTGSHTASVRVTVTSGTVTSDFSLSASPSAVSVTAGSSGSATIATADTAGTAEAITLSVNGAPSGVTATLSPTSVTAGGSSTLTIATTSSAAAGSYTLSVTGSAASGSHSVNVALTIASSGGGGGNTIFSDGFENGGWTSKEVKGTQGAWTEVTSSLYPSITAHGGTHWADFNSYTSATGSETRLYHTASVAIPSTITTATLTFWMYHDTGYSTYRDRIQAQLGVSGAWTSVGSAVYRDNGSTGWAQVSIDVSSYKGKTVQVAFVGISAYGNDEYVDDVAITTH